MDDGINRKLDPGKPEERNIYEAMQAGKEVKRIPMTFGEALEALDEDEVIQSAHARRDVSRCSATTSGTSGSATAPTVTDWDVERVPGRPAVRGRVARRGRRPLQKNARRVCRVGHRSGRACVCTIKS